MQFADWARGITRAIVAVDRSTIEVGFTLRCTLGVAIPLAVAIAAGHPSFGFAPAIGALICGFTSLQGIYRSRIATVLAVAIGITAASFIGALVAPYVAALVTITAIVGYFYGTVSQLGMPASVAALNTTVAFIIFSSLPHTPRQDFEQSLLLLGGALIQAVLLLIAWPIDRFTIERRGLAAAYRELAGYARSLAKPDVTVPPITALATARQIVADQQPLARARDVARVTRILTDAEALRHRLAGMTALRRDAPTDVPSEFTEFVEALGRQLDALASTLEGARSADGLQGIRLQTFATLQAFERAYAGEEFALALVRDIAEHLQSAAQAIAVAATGRPVRLLLSSQPRPAAYIETRIDWFSRDAIRDACVLSLAMLIGHTIFSADRGYWIALTAALVLRPDLQGTINRGFARIAGTLGGAVIAALLVAAFRGNPVLQSAGMVAAAGVCYLTLMPNYALFSTAMTVFVILALSLGGTYTGTIADRVLDTLGGGTLAMAGYLLFPTWARRRTRPLLIDFIDAQREFALVLLGAYADSGRIDRDKLAEIRTRAWKTRTELETSIDRARAEPRQPHTIDTDRALDILAATQSFALVNMALESGLETMPPAPPLPGLQPICDALDVAMREIAGALREMRHADIDDSLASAYDRLSQSTGISDPTHLFVVHYVGGYVQSVKTLAELTGL
ncbi:MAG: FUSC family protein [Candidatus Tumulicola sp.]